ncbi:hypothetical protein JCM6882_000675 [Rhodosporidiobolus microsporus]
MAAEDAPASHASTSAWQWVDSFGLYYNADTKQWAKPLPDGSWEYADAQPAPKERERVSYEDVDEGGGGDESGGGEPLPEEQVWPGDEDEQDDPPPDPYAKAPLLRLVVIKRPDPSVLPPAQTVASIDPGEPVTIGRDKSFERRIRLKELAVSKVHCTLFWSVEPELEDGGFWAVVDNGSTHGTFLSSEGMGKTRLSEAKVASRPHRLRHLDTLHVGSTTFSLHIHASFACAACSVTSDSSNLIPLVASSADGAQSGAPAYAGTRTKEEKEQDRREQMKGLKDKFLKTDGKEKKPAPTSSSSATSSKPAFVDRAAARRQRDASAITTTARPSSKSSKPAAAGSFNPFFAVSGAAASFSAPPSRASPAPPPADPFAAESKGAQLLSKLTRPANGAASSPSTTAAAAAAAAPTHRQPGLGTLIQPRTFDSAGAGGGGRDARPGLGSRELVEIEKVSQGRNGAGGRGGGGAGGGAAGEKRDWREDVREASRKRFREMG